MLGDPMATVIAWYDYFAGRCSPQGITGWQSEYVRAPS